MTKSFASEFPFTESGINGPKPWPTKFWKFRTERSPVLAVYGSPDWDKGGSLFVAENVATLVDKIIDGRPEISFRSSVNFLIRVLRTVQMWIFLYRPVRVTLPWANIECRESYQQENNRLVHRNRRLSWYQSGRYFWELTDRSYADTWHRCRVRWSLRRQKNW